MLDTEDTELKSVVRRHRASLCPECCEIRFSDSFPNSHFNRNSADERHQHLAIP